MNMCLLFVSFQLIIMLTHRSLIEATIWKSEWISFIRSESFCIDVELEFLVFTFTVDQIYFKIFLRSYGSCNAIIYFFDARNIVLTSLLVYSCSLQQPSRCMCWYLFCFPSYSAVIVGWQCKIQGFLCQRRSWIINQGRRKTQPRRHLYFFCKRMVSRKMDRHLCL